MRNSAIAAAILCAGVRAQLPAADAYSFDERAPSTRLERTVHDLLPRLVKVHGASGLATIQAYGTGMLVSAEGHVLTLDTVMLQEDQTRVVLHDGTVHEAALLPADESLGVRMLKIDVGRPLPFVDVAAAATDLAPGTFAVSIGNAFRLAEYSEKLSATFGVLVAKARTGLRYRLQDVDYDGELWITDAANNPGHGGGGLFTLDGRLVGLNARLMQSRETNTDISAAIPAADLAPYVARWTEGKVAAPPPPAPDRPVHHGIALFDHGGRTSPPPYVERVERGSPAARAGLRADDLIVRIGERTVRTCDQFRSAMDELSPGRTVSVTLKRGSRVLAVELTLEAAK